jgi:hypothetical protein
LLELHFLEFGRYLVVFPACELNGCQFRKKFKIRSIEVEDRGYIKQQKNKVKLKSLKIIDCTAEDGAYLYLRFGFLNIKNFVLQNLRLPQNAELNIVGCEKYYQTI